MSSELFNANRWIPVRALSLLAVLVTTFVGANPANEGDVATPIEQQTERQNPLPERLNAADWAAIREARERSRYQIRPGETGGFHANNPANDFRIHFQSDGTTDLASFAGAEEWSLSMQLKGIGYGSIQSVTAPQRLEADNDRLTYHWGDNLVEWWDNSSEGLEQWFRIRERSDQKGEGGNLRFQLELKGNLDAKLTDKGLVFTGVDSRIQYTKLVAWDADNEELPSHMRMNAGRLTLVVDDRDARYPVTIDPTFVQESYLKSSDASAFDLFGFDGSLAISGDTLVVGAIGAEGATFGTGAAYVFVRDSQEGWKEQAKLTAMDGAPGDQFGVSVAIHEDTIIVGARFAEETDQIADNFGSAYVFVRDLDGTWSQEAKLQAGNPEPNSQFGLSTAVDGDTGIVSAPGEGNGTGAVYVYTRNDQNIWSQQAYLKASNAEPSDIFGESVALSNDVLVIGASLEDSSIRPTERTPDNSETNNAANGAGAAYVFTRNNQGVWRQTDYLKAEFPGGPSENEGIGDRFGRSVAIDRNTIVVGALNEDSNAKFVNGDQQNNLEVNSGAGYVFIKDLAGRWIQQAYLKAEFPGGLTEGDAGDTFSDNFGASVSISGDMIVVGSPGEDSESTGVNMDGSNNDAPEAGAAHVFIRRDNSNWKYHYLKASNTDAGDLFGTSVAASRRRIVVAAVEDSAAQGVGGRQSMDINMPQNDNSAQAAGAAYVFNILTQLALEASDISHLGGGNRGLMLLEALNEGDANAFEVDLTVGLPAGLSPNRVFRLAPSCSVAADNDVSCDAEAIPAWQCAIDGQQVLCSLDVLPAGGAAAVVVDATVATDGPFNVQGEASATNADSVTASVDVGN